jgi:hypothetical protein
MNNFITRHGDITIIAALSHNTSAGVSPSRDGSGASRTAPTADQSGGGASASADSDGRANSDAIQMEIEASEFGKSPLFIYLFLPFSSSKFRYSDRYSSSYGNSYRPYWKTPREFYMGELEMPFSSEYLQCPLFQRVFLGQIQMASESGPALVQNSLGFVFSSSLVQASV